MTNRHYRLALKHIQVTVVLPAHGKYIIRRNGIKGKLWPNENKEDRGSVKRTAVCDWSAVRVVLA